VVLGIFFFFFFFGLRRFHSRCYRAMCRITMARTVCATSSPPLACSVNSGLSSSAPTTAALHLTAAASSVVLATSLACP
jgi:hypothetical protein